MITYLYWLLVAALIFGTLFLVGVRHDRWKPAIIISVILWLAGTLLYYFWLEQIFVKRFGGRMSVTVPDGQMHVAATWKEDNLWIENYDPDTNECIFSEYSRGNVLEGRVIIRNCSPVRASAASPGGTSADIQTPEQP